MSNEKDNIENNGIIPEIAAEMRMREMQAQKNQKSIESIPEKLEKLSRLSDLITKMRKASDQSTALEAPIKRGNEQLRKVVKEIDENEMQKQSAIKPEVSKAAEISLNQLKDIAERSLDADLNEQKMLKEQLGDLRSFIKESVNDTSELEFLNRLGKIVSESVKHNTSILSQFSDSLLGGITNNLMPAIVGTVAGVFADSPIVGVVTGLLGQIGQNVFERRQEKLKRKREAAQIRLQELSAEHTARLVELQELEQKQRIRNQDTSSIQKEKEKVEMEKLNVDRFASAIAEELDLSFDDLVKEISNGLKSKFEQIGLDLEDINSNSIFDRSIEKDNDKSSNLFGETFEEPILNQLMSIKEEIIKGNAFNKKGVEERRRDSAFEREELINAINSLKVSGSDKEEAQKLTDMLEKLDFLGLGALFATVGALFTKMFVFSKKLLKIAKSAFIPITGVISVFSGVRDAFEDFKQNGNILKALSTGLISTADVIIKSFTLGFLDIEKIGGFLRDVIPESLSDSVFKVVDWFTGIFDDPIESLQSATGNLMRLVKNALLAPIFAITDYFGVDAKGIFSNISSFLGDMSETVFQWIASIIPDFVPDAAIPDSILKYKDSSVAADVATQEFKELEQEIGQGSIITPAMILELQKARHAMQDAQFFALRDKLSENGVIDTNSEDFKKLRELRLARKETLESIEKTESKIQLIRDSDTKQLDTNKLTMHNEINPVFQHKTDKARIGEVLSSKNQKIVEMKNMNDSNKGNSNGSTAINTNSRVTNNVSNTHISKEVFNSDPSIMKPVLN